MCPARAKSITCVLLLVACGIQDPGNLGAIIRSGQALGADALIALRETVSPFNPKTVRASAGAILGGGTPSKKNERT